jgi:hypothetical protein
MNKFIYFLIFLAILLLAWMAWSFFSIRNVEQLEYKVVEKNENYEVRQYKSFIVAETVVENVGYSEALNEGFRRIAGYIFGGNKAKESIAMTTPVTEALSEKIDMTVPVTEQVSEKIDMTVPVIEQVSEKIDMTAPVTEKKESEKSRKISFVMPSKYTMDTLPIPNDDRVQLREVPARKMAVLSFSWYATSSRVEAKKQELINVLKDKGVSYVGEPIYAGYNPPFSFPAFLRNEIMVELAE